MSQEFGAVLVAGLAIFGLVLVANEADFDFSGTSEPDSITIFTESFGQVGDAQADDRQITFGDFTVGEGRGDVLAYRDDREQVVGKLFGSQPIVVNYNATQPDTGSIEFEVLGREGDGAIFVKVNGRKVWENHLVSGGTPEVTIPAEDLNVGNNRIVIGSTSGGWISSTRYTIEDLKVRVNDRKFHDYIDTFQMYDYELFDFVEATLEFNIVDAVKTEPLTVEINDRQVYSLDRVRGRETVEINPENSDLHTGYNVVKFGTEGEAQYSLEDAGLTVRYVGKTEEAALSRNFYTLSSNVDYADRNSTEEKIVFDYQNLLGTQRPLSISLNSNDHVITPNNGRNTIRVDGEIESNNTLVIQSNSTFQLNNFRIVSEQVDN